VAPAYIPAELRRQVRADASARCGYCHTPEALVGMPLEYDHLRPVALDGSTVREHLWLACTRCNDFQGDRIEGLDIETGETVSLFNSRTQRWLDHFVWATTGTRILGLTATGHAAWNGNE